MINTYYLKLGASYGIDAQWEAGGSSIRVEGFSGNLLLLNCGRRGLNLNNTDPTPLMFFAMEGGTLVDVSTRLNVDRVSTVINRTTLIADYNGDGLTDIFLGNFGTEKFSPFPGEQNQLLFQTTSGQFINKTSTLPKLTDATHVPALGDLNGDGYLDIFVNNIGDDDNSPNYILINDGKGYFTYQADTKLNANSIFDQSVSQYLSSPISLIIDINLDGENDIFYGPLIAFPMNDAGFGYLENNDGVFSVKINNDLFWPGDSTEYYYVEKADFNHDGYSDIAIAGFAEDRTLLVQLYYSGPGGVKNVSKSVLDLSEMLTTPTSGGPSFEVADVNGDDSPDFEIRGFISGYTSEIRYTFINDGKGNFGAPIKNLNGIASAVGAYVDLNGDGLLDFVHPIVDYINPSNDGLRVLFGESASVEKLIRGTVGNDVLEGSSKLDKAIYSGVFSGYELKVGAFSLTIADKIPNRDGTDTLTDIERLQFTDLNLALDTDAANSAGGIYRLYKAALDRDPDLSGLGYWIAQADAGTKDAVRMATDFTYADEFKTLYGVQTADNYMTGEDITALVTKIYENVLNRAPDAGGRDYYAGQITTKSKTVGQVLAEISDSAENKLAVVELIATGIEYTPWVG
jgi:hypothetical protein